MTLNEERALYECGIELFNAEQFFEAHEVWEDAWRDADGEKRKFFQGLIQCAVALEHYRRSNPRGVASLHRTYPTKFQNLPSRFMGLDVSRFLAAMEVVLGPVVTQQPLSPRGAIHLQPGVAPKIVLSKYDDLPSHAQADATHRASG